LPSIDDNDWVTELEAADDEAALVAEAVRNEGMIAAVHFDPPSAKSGSVVALVHFDDLAHIERGRYVTIVCKGDGRKYVGRIAEGPFFNPDVLKADSTPVKFIVINQGRVQGKVLSLPEYHGIIIVELLGEERDVEVVGANRRPHPGSAVFAHQPETMTAMFRLDGDIVLGHLDGYTDVLVHFDSTNKDVIPRNLLTVGTIGSGKSNTNQVIIEETLDAGYAQVVLDPEGEYVLMDKPAEGMMLAERLRAYGREPRGIADVRVYVPPKTTPKRPDSIRFSVPFDSLAPEVVMELTEMTGPQQQRFPALYGQAITLLRKGGGTAPTGIGDRDDLDVSRGYPGITLALLLNMLNEEIVYFEWKRDWGDKWEAAEKKARERDRKADRKGEAKPSARNRAVAATEESDDVEEERDPFDGIPDKPEGYMHRNSIKPLLEGYPDFQAYMGLRRHLRDLDRMGVFDQRDATPLKMEELATPRRLSVIDLSDVDDQRFMNIIIADLLARMYRYKMRLSEEENSRKKVMITLEEAHGFVPRERMEAMAQTFYQLRRIIRRGRKRWLVMHFVTQSPQHLPAELFELTNNKIIHQMTGGENLKVLRNAAGDVNEAIWDELPTLGRGRAILVSGQFPHPIIARIRVAASRRNYLR
jgi:DNA helicase HerA-like ATPase